MKYLVFFILFGSVMLQSQSVFSQNELFQKKSFIIGADTLPYRILYPDNFDTAQHYPLILFLHGSDESGNDNQSQLKHGGKLFSSPETRAHYPAIVIFPQCPTQSFWASADFPEDNSGYQSMVFNPFGEPTLGVKLLMGLVDQLTEEQFVDKKCIYIGGLSLGGMGTFELLHRRPDIFAAAFPICGGGNTSSVDNYALKVKIWAFHGAKDDVVPPVLSIQMVDAINKAGGDAKLTIYPEANHGVWDNVFAEPELLKWLFSVKK
jgi:predicted peptidase